MSDVSRRPATRLHRAAAAVDRFAGGVGRDQRSCRAAERAGRGRRAVDCERVRKASAMAP